MKHTRKIIAFAIAVLITSFSMTIISDNCAEAENEEPTTVELPIIDTSTIEHNVEFISIADNDDVNDNWSSLTTIDEMIDENRYSSIEMTDEDRGLLALCIYHECRGEPFDGQRAVCEVILNRVLSDQFPNTVKEVIFQKGQFSTKQAIQTSAIKEPDCLAVAFDVIETVLHNDDYVLDVNCGYFKSSSYKHTYKHIGSHYFALM